MIKPPLSFNFAMVYTKRNNNSDGSVSTFINLVKQTEKSKREQPKKEISLSYLKVGTITVNPV